MGLVIECLICRKNIPVEVWESKYQVCEECKKAVEKMKEMNITESPYVSAKSCKTCRYVTYYIHEGEYRCGLNHRIIEQPQNHCDEWREHHDHN